MKIHLAFRNMYGIKQLQLGTLMGDGTIHPLWIPLKAQKPKTPRSKE